MYAIRSYYERDVEELARRGARVFRLLPPDILRADDGAAGAERG